MTNQPNAWVKKKLQELRQLYGNKCFKCGATQNLEFAHIRPTGLNGIGRGRKERYYDIINHPKDYILACKQHNDDAEVL